MFIQAAQTNSINAPITASVGTHQVVTRAWDSTGAYGSVYEEITVNSGVVEAAAVAVGCPPRLQGQSSLTTFRIVVIGIGATIRVVPEAAARAVTGWRSTRAVLRATAPARNSSTRACGPTRCGSKSWEPMMAFTISSGTSTFTWTCLPQWRPGAGVRCLPVCPWLQLHDWQPMRLWPRVLGYLGRGFRPLDADLGFVPQVQSQHLAPCSMVRDHQHQFAPVHLCHPGGRWTRLLR